MLIARRVVVVVGVVALLVVSSPDANASSTATIVRAASYCTVDALAWSTGASCPIDSRKMTGAATAVAPADVAARTFAIGASAQPNRYYPRGRSASGILELHSNQVRSQGGSVKVVLSNLSGRSTRRCTGLCAALGSTGASTGVWVQLLVKGSTDVPQALCPITWTGETAPPTLVVPDDCPDATLNAPPNSTFEVVVMLIAQAQAAGGPAQARSSLTGVVSEIRVP